MQETFRALIAELGGQVFSPMPTSAQGYGIAAGGTIIHELGGARMGDDPKTSVTNRWCQAHDCKNLFVADGGRSEEHTSELQSRLHLVCRLLLEKKKKWH